MERPGSPDLHRKLSILGHTSRQYRYPESHARKQTRSTLIWHWKNNRGWTLVHHWTLLATGTFWSAIHAGCCWEFEDHICRDVAIYTIRYLWVIRYLLQLEMRCQFSFNTVETYDTSVYSTLRPLTMTPTTIVFQQVGFHIEIIRCDRDISSG